MQADTELATNSVMTTDLPPWGHANTPTNTHTHAHAYTNTDMPASGSGVDL